MAKIKLGALAGQVSGSIGTYTFAHNRGGAYVRLRSIPDKFTTPYAMAAKSRLALCSSNWSLLQPEQRASWTEWARQNPVTDTLGEKRPLDGHQAYVSLAVRLVLAGELLPTTPPGKPHPDGIETITVTADTGTGAFQVAFTPATLPTGLQLWVQGCPVANPAVNFVKNRLKFIMNGADTTPSPLDIETDFELRFGVPATGSTVVIWASVFDPTTGLLSMPTEGRATVTHT